MHATTRMILKPRRLLAIVVSLGLVFAGLSLADPPPHSHGGEDPPPPEPSVGYVVTWLGTIGGTYKAAHAINNGGVVVGSGDLGGERHAFRVIPDMNGNGDLIYYRDDDGDGLNDLLEDLNVLGVWVDHTGNPVAGCTAVSANDINEHDEIVGTADCGGQTRVFVFDPNVEPAELILLPPPPELVGAGGDYFGSAINDAGDIVGFRRAPDIATSVIFYRCDPELLVLDLGIPLNTQYFPRVDINNRGDFGEVQIVTGAGFRLTLGLDSSLIDAELFDLLHIYAINDLGTFCGNKEEVGKGKQKDPGGAFRYSGNPDEELKLLLDTDSSSIGGRGINSDGDVIVSPGWLYHDSFGLLVLEDLVVNPPKWGPGNERFNPFGMTDRDDATGFPAICGRGIINGVTGTYNAWVLTPFNLP